MPWTAKQLKLFRAAAHNPAIAKSHGLSQAKASEMSKEGLKKAGGGMLKQAVGNRDTKHGLLDLPVTLGKAMKKPKMRFGIGGTIARLTGPDPLKIMPKSFRESAYFDPLGSAFNPDTEYNEKMRRQRAAAGMKKGGDVKKPAKAKILKAVLAAHQAGIQKGAMAAQRPAGPPGIAGLPPGGGAPMGPGMKAGGKVAPKEKWTPPWAKKGKKFAAGGCVGGGRGDGCATKGRTKGRMV